MNKRRFSPSALDRYASCPRQFLFADIERRPREERPSPQLVQANAVHHALERFFGLRPEERSLDALHQILRSVWPEHRQPDSFSSRDDEIFWGRGALELLERFLRCFDADGVSLARERWASVRLANGFDIYGKIDRVDEAANDGEIELVDYKTGKYQLESDDLRHDRAAQVYVLAARNLYRRPVKRVRYLYLRSGEAAEWWPTEEEVEIANASLVSLIDEIASDGIFEPRPGSACRFCSYKHLCPEQGQVELAEFVPIDNLPF